MKLLTIAKEAAACRAACETADANAWYRHMHHERLCEPATEPIAHRIDYILTHKPKGERALRLRLLRPIVGALPTELLTAWAAYETAGAAYRTAWAAYETAYRDALPALEALHAAECEPDCPWDGRTISP